MAEKFYTSAELQDIAFTRISKQLGEETALYKELQETNYDVNLRVAKERPELGISEEQAKEISRVMHCATRYGTPAEYRKMTQIFEGMDMHPVNFYDLTEGGENAQPFIATAFRSLRNVKHRMFASLLMPDYFEPETRKKIDDALADRNIISDDLVDLAKKSSKQNGLYEKEALQFLDGFVDMISFKGVAKDHDLYVELKKKKFINVADIVCFDKDIKANHATPFSLDIDFLYAEMKSRLGKEYKNFEHRGMKDTIEGPPPPESHEEAIVFLRQTSYNALKEKVKFYNKDGSITEDLHVVRFGEIEQRGVAMTPKGREIYDACINKTLNDIKKEIDGKLYEGKALAVKDYKEYVRQYKQCFKDMPKTHKELREQGLAYYTYHATEKGLTAAKKQLIKSADINYLVDNGFISYEPIRYNDFLPVSAGGIFGSNDPNKKTEEEFAKYRAKPKQKYQKETLEEIMGKKIVNYVDISAAEEAQSKLEIISSLGLKGIASSAEIGGLNKLIKNDPSKVNGNAVSV